jgi:hypothetical protein
MAPHTRSTCRRRMQRRYDGTLAGISSTHAGPPVAVAPADHAMTVTIHRPCVSGRSSRAFRSASEDASRHRWCPNTTRPTPELELHPGTCSRTLLGATGTAPGQHGCRRTSAVTAQRRPRRPAGRTVEGPDGTDDRPGLSPQPPARPRPPEIPHLPPCIAALSAAGRTPHRLMRLLRSEREQPADGPSPRRSGRSVALEWFAGAPFAVTCSGLCCLV